ncbi:MAG TPA: ComEC/Rec2 family competence protein [Bacteroidia bacterium]|nr:ComEC/Rec2 family competence protein [Bacteroidia bacterium]
MQSLLPRIPLLRLVIPFCAGIVFSYSFHPAPSVPVFALAAVLVSVALLLFPQVRKRTLRLVGMEGLLVSAGMFFAGAALTEIKLGQVLSADRKEHNLLAVVFRITEEPVVKERSVKVVAEIRYTKDSSGWKAASGKMLAYIRRDPEAEKLRYGDVLLVNASPQETEAPKNPGEFDYRSWLLRQGISEQLFAAQDHWKLLRNDGNWFRSAALTLRKYFMRRMQESGISGDEFSVASALLLGASDHLDPDLMHAYSASGTMHVLSVSGMHVALVYVVLLRLLGPFERRRGGKWPLIVLQLIFLWFYATLTGLCPSVLRSVTMLSVVIAGKAFGRKTHILNSLSASALILLATDPMLLFDAGFQLSYLAVAGIVTLQPALQKLWKPEVFPLRHVWTLISVTLVAQVFTFPIGLYYFHQFPTWFLLSNLLVIPLATIVMYAGLLFLAVSPFVFMAGKVAVIFSFLVALLNGAVKLTEYLPFNVLHSSAWTVTEILLLYVSVVAAVLFFIRKRGTWMNFSLAGFCTLLFLVSCSSVRTARRREMVFFCTPKGTAIGLKEGNAGALLTDSAFNASSGTADFYAAPFFNNDGIEQFPIKNFTVKETSPSAFYRLEKNVLLFEGKTVLLLDKNSAQEEYSGSYYAVLVMSSFRGNVARKLENVKMEKVIIGCGISPHRREKMRGQLQGFSCAIISLSEHSFMIAAED